MKRLNHLYLLLLLPLLFSCKKDKSSPALFTLMQNTGIRFSNDISNSKDFNILSYRNFYNGGGAGIGDINNDGLPDLFFTANMGPNKLYLNKGNWKFEDITDKAGISNEGKWGTGVVFADINSDGLLDIYVCNAGYQKGVSNENDLYINQGNLQFKEAAKEYGLNESGYTTHAAFFDYDLDGDLDCYILKNSFIPVNTLNYANKRDLRAEDWPVADFLKGGGDKLLKNEGGRYVDVSKQANIYGSLIGFGLGVTVGDVNGDHYPDLYISNDFFERDYLYINQRNGSFREELEEWMQHISHSSMGADIADINNDGFPDIFTTDMLPDDDYRLKTTTSFESIDVKNLKVSSGFYQQYTQNTLQINNRNGKFLETGFYSGVAASDWSWGGLIFDADNDGYSDLFVCNGIYQDVTDQDFIDFFANDVFQKMAMTGKKEQVEEIISKMPSRPIPNKAFRNNGNLKFTDEGSAWGLAQPSFSNGAAYGDLDGDGDLDLVVNNVNQEAFIYRNNTREQLKNHFIGFRLIGTDPNRFAIGSSVKIFSKDQVLSRELIPSRGFQSSVDYTTIVGLGKAASVDSMIVYWPDRTCTKIINPPVNRVQIIDRKLGSTQVDEVATRAKEKLFDKVSTVFEKHTEDPFIDFYYERGVPMMLTREGPGTAVGDVNGDGLEDVYICGAAGQTGQLYLQNGSGFRKKENAVTRTFADVEEVTAAFFDADGDRDLDLFTGHGGNRRQAPSPEYRNTIYLNEGKGNFTPGNSQLENSGMNTSCVAPHDFDGDGDIDLFVGSRSVPLKYGALPRSFIYLNNGKGEFVDMAREKNPDIAGIGMVTSATWSDLTGDGKKELVIVGEWMAPVIFHWNGDRFTEIKSNLSDLHGWWKAVEASDLDGDGDQDLVLGNLGENFYLQPDKEKPVKMWVNDFDENGTVEKIISRTVDGKDKPVFLKRDLVDQIASLRKQNLKYAEFANRSVPELFSSRQMKDAQVRLFNYTSSCIAYNEGNGKFTIVKLPWEVQLSCVNSILTEDIDKDGRMDLVMGGNQFNFLPQFSRLDASYGHVLLNKGKRTFSVVSSNQSGIELRGEIRNIKEIRSRNKNYVLVLQNDQHPVLYQSKN